MWKPAERIRFEPSRGRIPTADEARGVNWQCDVFNAFAAAQGLECTLANSDPKSTRLNSSHRT